jgi:FixJ family two-component response regulator
LRHGAAQALSRYSVLLTTRGYAADEKHKCLGAVSLDKQIYIVDADPEARETLSVAFSREGYHAVCFSDGAALLATARNQSPVSIILDVDIPGKSGLEIFKQLKAEGYPAPIFIVSGQGSIPKAVDAIKNGAADFIEKPLQGSEIVARVRASIEGAQSGQKNDETSGESSFYFPGRKPLTRRERDVLAQLIKGSSAKEAGRSLGISSRTIDDHRARIIKKLGAKNTADLIRFVMSENRADLSR